MDKSISDYTIKRNIISLWNVVDTLQNEYIVSKTEILRSININNVMIDGLIDKV